MEGDLTYTDSYNALKKIIKANTTSSVTIDYSKLDEQSASIIRITLSRVLGERQREVWKVISGAK